MTATACVFVRTEIDLPSLFDGVAAVLTQVDPAAPAAAERRVYVKDGEIGYEPSQGLPALAWVVTGTPSEFVPPHSARAYFDAPLVCGSHYVASIAIDLCRWLTANGHGCGWRVDYDYLYHDYAPGSDAALRREGEDRG